MYDDDFEYNDDILDDDFPVYDDDLYGIDGFEDEEEEDDEDFYVNNY